MAILERTPIGERVLPRGRSLFAALSSTRALIFVALVVLGLALWRFAFVLSGVDPDSDAYGHHAIARQILVTPRDLSVHWVWLPLFHYLQALGVVLGATLQTVRLVNVLLAAAVPVMLHLALQDHRARNPEDGLDPAPTIAALLAALSPIAMQMGTTGQSESLFVFLVLAVVLSLDRNRPALAGVALTCAVLLRYEAWALPPAIACFLLLARVPFIRRRLLAHERGQATDGLRAWLPVILPALAILVWAWIRRNSEGSWFLFLKQTREFANGALGAKSSFALGPKQVVEDLQYYAIKVPWRVVGYPLLLAPFGVVRTFRRDGLRFFGIFSAALAFVTLTWLLRSSLGLDRHFVVLVPFYATLIANGIVAIAKFCDDLAKRPFAASIHAFAASGAVRAAFIAGFACAVVGNTWTILDVWMRDWRNASEGAWPDRREIANRLRDLDGAIFCDEPTVELLSGLPRTRFDRRMLEDPRARSWIGAALATGKPVYVATWAVKLESLKVRGPILTRSPGSSGNTGFVLMRVDGD
jgi:hypothetical protein